MLLNQLRHIQSQNVFLSLLQNPHRLFRLKHGYKLQTAKPIEVQHEEKLVDMPPLNDRMSYEMFPTAKVVPMVVRNKDTVVLPFDDVPGPKSLKFVLSIRQYLSEIGTQLTAGILTFALNISK